MRQAEPGLPHIETDPCQVLLDENRELELVELQDHVRIALLYRVAILVDLAVVQLQSGARELQLGVSEGRLRVLLRLRERELVPVLVAVSRE